MCRVMLWVALPYYEVSYAIQPGSLWGHTQGSPHGQGKHMQAMYTAGQHWLQRYVQHEHAQACTLWYRM